MVKLQNYQRIKAGNFKGLNLRDISICLQGEIALAQAALAENESRNDVSLRGLNDLRQKIEELSDLLKIVDEQVVKDVNHLASKDIKMGAKLNQVGELEEWLQLQKGFNDAQKNNNIFTYKNVKLRQQRSTEITDLSLIEELQRLQKKTPLTAVPTRESSEHKDLSTFSFYQRAENAKLRVKEIGQRVDSDQEMQIDIASLIQLPVVQGSR